MSDQSDQPKFHDAERVDVPDLEFAAGRGLAWTSQVGGSLLTDPAGDVRAYVINGFQPEVNGPSTDKQLKIRRGVALLSRRDGGEVTHGILTTEGESSRVVDMSAAAVAYHAVWIKVTLLEGQSENRNFWDPSGPNEYQQSTTTRLLANWNLTTTQYPGAPSAGTRVNPGEEWCFVGDAQITSTDIIVTPQRTMFFEGLEAGGFAPDWGSGDDRDSDRDTNGLHDFRRFVQATLKKLEEIQSGTDDWWEAPPEPLDQKVSRNGDTMDGDYIVTGTLNADGGLFCDTPQDIGALAEPFDTIYAKTGVFIDGGPDIELRATSSVGQAKISFYNDSDTGEFFQLLYNLAFTNFAALISDAPILFGPDGANPNSESPLLMFATEMYPSADNSVAVGKTANRYSEVHGRLTYALQLLAEGAGTSTVGLSGNKWAEAHLVTLFADQTGQDFVPQTTLVQSLGNSSKIFDECFADSVFTNLIQSHTVDDDLSIVGNGDGDVLIANTGGIVGLSGNIVFDSEGGTLIKGTGSPGDAGDYGATFYASHSGQNVIELQCDVTPGGFFRFDPKGHIGDDLATDSDPVIAQVNFAGISTSVVGGIKIHVAGFGNAYLPFVNADGG